eukprot:3881334-Amphidinium_carterae.1
MLNEAIFCILQTTIVLGCGMNAVVISAAIYCRRSCFIMCSLLARPVATTRARLSLQTDRAPSNARRLPANFKQFDLQW